MLTIFRKLDKNRLDISNEQQIIIYDFSICEKFLINLQPRNITLMKFFKDGFIYVSNSNNLFYYDLINQKDNLLYTQSKTIILLASENDVIVSMDKGYNINVFNFSQ